MGRLELKEAGMRIQQRFFVAGVLALSAGLGSTGPTLTAQTISTTGAVSLFAAQERLLARFRPLLQRASSHNEWQRGLWLRAQSLAAWERRHASPPLLFYPLPTVPPPRSAAPCSRAPPPRPANGPPARPRDSAAPARRATRGANALPPAPPTREPGAGRGASRGAGHPRQRCRRA